MQSNKDKLRKKYFEIFMLCLNSDYTLEEIGVKYNLTKQRVWQIVRFNHIGKGDYYEGYRQYTNKYNALLNDTSLSTIERNTLMRDWLSSHDVRLIRSKNDTKVIT